MTPEQARVVFIDAFLGSVESDRKLVEEYANGTDVQQAFTKGAYASLLYLKEQFDIALRREGAPFTLEMLGRRDDDLR